MVEETFLSPYVHHIIVELLTSGAEQNDLSLISSCDFDDIFKTLGSAMDGNGLETKEDYLDAILAVGPTAWQLYKFYKSKKNLFDEDNISFKWLSSYGSCPERISFSMSPGLMMLSLLQLTATIERALGDVYALSGKSCPFLLRDLVATVELSQMFRVTKMKIMKICIGSPFGLNLRNLVWHGFISPQEMPNIYISLLVFACDGIALEIERKNLLSSIQHRPIIHQCQPLEILQSYFGDTELQIEKDNFTRNLLRSEFVPSTFLLYFDEALSFYNVGKFAHCAILLLPCIENVLRKLFACCNNCEHRVLTAECSSLYTTMDEILAESVEEGKENEIRNVLGDNIMVLMFDLFSMLRGPRLRDRLSHGELALEILSRKTAGILICLLFYISFPRNQICRKLQDNTTFESSDESSPSSDQGDVLLKCLNDFEAKLSEYESFFHPLAIAKRTCLECFENISALSAIPVPEEFSESADIKQNSCDNSAGNTLRNTKLRTLYRDDRKDMEVVLILEKISKECLSAVRCVRVFLRQRWQSYTARTLRSRQRANYRKLIIRLPEVRWSCWRILEMVSQRILLIAVNSEDVKPFSVRRLKRELKLAENFRTLTAENKWDEVCSLKLPE